MKYGYARTQATDEQFKKELELLKVLGCKKIVFDVIPEYRRYGNNFLQLIQNAQKGDVLVVYSFSRLCNTLAELSTIISCLVDARMGLISLKEQIDSNTFEGTLFLHSMTEISLDHLDEDISINSHLRF
jgi:DNA invertase Pin-like site-specific DNA recombinase